MTGRRVALPPTSEEWKQLEPVIDAVLDAPPSERAALLARLSVGDAARLRELATLVAECEQAYPLLEGRAADHFAHVLGDAAPPMPETLAERYRIIGEAGRGGMAIVYLARDLRYGREVAIKVVRPELAAAIGRQRFLLEIEIAARLRHPHIVPLYDSGEVTLGGTSGEIAASLLYYVMPYEVGQSLRERLDQHGPLPIRELLVILRDVCEALAYAHRQSIVHRDIKPDNVLLSNGHALVADFGIARAVTEASANGTAGTGSAALGTPTYMAPEQATGSAPVDHRADIYAVGVLAQELLTGHTPSSEDERSSRSRDHVARELTRAREDVQPRLVAAIVKCLATRPEDRWQSADDLLAELAQSSNPVTTPATNSGSRFFRSVTLAAALVVTAILVLARERARDRRMVAILRLGRAAQLTSERGLEVQPSISPDGRYVAYAVGHSLRMRIAVKPIAGGRVRWLASDSDTSAWLPRWSPDGERILFLARGGVFSAPALVPGPVREEVADRPGAIIRSATWSPDAREIAYVRGDSLLARSVGSGATRLLTTGSDLHSCRWSPEGAWLACVSGNSFYVTVGAVSGEGPMFANLAPSRIVLVPAAGGIGISVTNGDALNQSPIWSPDGGTLYYVSNRQGPRDVYALDVHALRPLARTVRGLEAVRITTGLGAQSIDLSSDGTRLAYAAYSSTANVFSIPIPARARPTPVSATPRSTRAVTSGDQTVEGVRVSPDGEWLVYDSDLGGNSAIYRVRVTGGESERLTSGAADVFRGTISPNGRELAYHSFQSGSRNLFLLDLAHDSARQLTRYTGQFAMANWSPDGSALAFFDMIGTRVMMMQRDAEGHWGAPRFTGAHGWRAEWAPDGRAIAFVSPTDGRIGLVPADSGVPRYLYVPRRGDPLAELALFAANGRDLYFKSHDSSGRASFWSIPVTGGHARRIVQFEDPSWSSNRFDFASDGKRFYFTVEDRQSDLWVAEIARR